MLHLATALQGTPQEERLSYIVSNQWHQYVVVFVRDKAPQLVAVLIVAFILLRLVRFFVTRLQRRAAQQVGNFHRAAQMRTMASILRATSFGVIGFLAFLQILTLFGIPYEPLLASAGILGVGIGLGAQSIFKDMLNGIFILLEDQYNVGEVVAIAGLKGTVEDLSLRSTRLRDGDGTLYVIPNSQIATVSNQSRDFSVAQLSVSVDASANPDHVMDLLRKLADGVRGDSAFKDVVISDPEILGVNEIRGREVIYPINIRVRVNQRDGVLRELRRRIILAFEKEGIPLGISSNMLVMQQKADPTAPPAAPTLGG
ncbi:mechanosensitive ion channel family protein [Edaphobacter modestus]|uniref:Small conductance mechanosensitive channel n=1 Tax=Edaphobacter modestus TaxID=388466 RepID=A0A4Q7YRI5_9BACT|nr:mechanosensitive ion channel domain-containing protein [Edaphobacter modestus]RZU39561.1 small conductance mechanosensitive channel [Edaphobacter modestus]